MKPKFYVFFSFILIACSSNIDRTNSTCLDNFRNPEANKTGFHISLLMEIEKDDVLEVYYIDDPKKQAFQSDKKIRKKVLGNTQNQEIQFNLPDKIKLHKFRIDLGENRNQKNIKIQEIKIGHKENVISIKDSLIPYFFDINNYLDLNNKNGDFKIQDKENKRDPFIISNATLIKKMKIEL